MMHKSFFVASHDCFHAYYWSLLIASLGLIGVTIALLLFNQLLGFVVMLGTIALSDHDDVLLVYLDKSKDWH